MKALKYLLVVACLLSATQYASAQQPLVTQNVTVLEGIEASQCPQNWEGSGAPVTAEENTSVGQVYGTSAGVMSCTNCAFVAASKSCVCKTCYEHYN